MTRGLVKYVPGRGYFRAVSSQNGDKFVTFPPSPQSLNGSYIEIGTFSADVVPKEVNVITAKWMFAWKTDSDGYITKAKTRSVARGFGPQLGVDYFNTFAPTPTVSSIKVALAIEVQNDWSFYDFDDKQAFVQGKLDTDVYMKLPYGCGERTGKVVKLDRAPYRIKQAGRQ